jgi:predicted ATPase
MRIYFSASHSCGKTTLARHVSTQYNLPMLSESARMILSEQELQVDKLRCDLEASNKFSIDVFNRQLSEEQKLSEFVSDRSAIDILAYSAQHSSTLPSLIKDFRLEQYLTSLRSEDSHCFLIRPSKTIMQSDGVREVLNWDGMVAIDAMIKLLLEMWEIKYYIINTDNLSERVRCVDSVLSSYMKEETSSETLVERYRKSKK